MTPTRCGAADARLFWCSGRLPPVASGDLCGVTFDCAVTAVVTRTALARGGGRTVRLRAARSGAGWPGTARTGRRC